MLNIEFDGKPAIGFGCGVMVVAYDSCASSWIFVLIL